jgi:disulfide bond formation protein DsbB
MFAISVLAMERFSALLAIIAAIGAVALVVARLVPAGARLIDMIRPARLWLAWLVAAVATAGSLYFSEIAHFAPCKLCWYQRIAMYSLALLLLIAALRRDGAIRFYAVPVAMVGCLLSSYHYLIEWYPSLEGATGSCDITVSCTAPWFRQFGFISLSLMALCGFAAIISLLTIGETASHRPERSNEDS